MVNDSKEEIPKAKSIYVPTAKCCKTVMANTVVCTKCKWMHGRCVKTKKVSSTLAKGFACKGCI